MDWMILAEAMDFYLLQLFQTASGAHPASHLMDTGDTFTGGRVGEAGG